MAGCIRYVSVANGRWVDIFYESPNHLGCALEHRVPSAEQFGLPQPRRRVFFMGARDQDAVPQPRGWRRRNAKFEVAGSGRWLETFLGSALEATWNGRCYDHGRGIGEVTSDIGQPARATAVELSPVGEWMVGDMDVKRISSHMLEIGLGALAHANWHSNFAGFMNAHWPELSVLQAAHAAELLVKARIAEEHPLLVFERLPAFQKNKGALDLSQLVEQGRAIGYSDLPAQLWATTGVTLPAIDQYEEFGRLRNSIQHFIPPPDKNLNKATAEFIFSVIDPFLNDCWGLFAIDFNEDDEPYRYVVEHLVSEEVLFLVSPEAASALSDEDVDFSRCRESYRREMLNRFAQASKEAD